MTRLFRLNYLRHQSLKDEYKYLVNFLRIDNDMRNEKHTHLKSNCIRKYISAKRNCVIQYFFSKRSQFVEQIQFHLSATFVNAFVNVIPTSKCFLKVSF